MRPFDSVVALTSQSHNLAFLLNRLCEVLFAVHIETKHSAAIGVLIRSANRSLFAIETIEETRKIKLHFALL